MTSHITLRPSGFNYGFRRTSYSNKLDPKTLIVASILREEPKYHTGSMALRFSAQCDICTVPAVIVVRPLIEKLLMCSWCGIIIQSRYVANPTERRGRKVTGLTSRGLHDSGIAACKPFLDLLAVYPA